VAIHKKFIREQFSKIDIQKAYPNLFHLLWYSQLPCFDVKGFSDWNNEVMEAKL
jgi:hypothetical protein